MVQNLLSETSTNGSTERKKRESAPVAFRVPEKESAASSSRPSAAPAKPAEQQKEQSNAFTPLHPVSPNAEKDTSHERSPNRDETGFTAGGAIAQGVAVDILAGAEKPAVASLGKTILLLFAGLLLGYIVIGVASGVLLSQRRALAAARKATLERGAAAAEFLRSVTERRKTVEAQLQNVDTARTLLAQHVHWTRFFRFLEAVTLPDVYYTNLAVGEGARVQLAAVGRDFAFVARQLLSFEESSDVEMVRMTRAAVELAGTAPGVRFDIELTVKPDLLFFQQ